jgi:asparagine synthetase B (glutamine-hydrolysing)
MCGIAGIFEGRIAEDSYPDILKKMADAIIHRGPDDEGYLLPASATHVTPPLPAAGKISSAPPAAVW